MTDHIVVPAYIWRELSWRSLLKDWRDWFRIKNGLLPNG